MSLVHEFVLVKRPQILTCDLPVLWGLKEQAYNNGLLVHLHDDLLIYMMDSIKWFRSTNPFKDESINGLFYHGISMIDSEAAAVLNNILQGWIILFSAAPDIISLTGNYFTIEGEPEVPGQYETITFSRKDVLLQLNKLSGLSQQAMKDTDDLIIHYGI